MDPCAHTESCLHIHLLREKQSLSALPRLLPDGLGSGHEAVPDTKPHPALAGSGTHLPSAPFSLCPAKGGQIGNESLCAWVNELITLHGCCQLCFCSL